ncbi:hypothetical protein Q7C36_002183 [Tachysurus vachellii]|uniref:Uncharacterized protein n=1 Tax=Tachysurus vachellii TaxID=175792 RepID=A0AA88NXD6_TACVA|nr:hypothetical protein Q7C36_002183 [Tachysurus vachellii]
MVKQDQSKANSTLSHNMLSLVSQHHNRLSHAWGFQVTYDPTSCLVEELVSHLQHCFPEEFEEILESFRVTLSLELKTNNRTMEEEFQGYELGDPLWKQNCKL